MSHLGMHVNFLQTFRKMPDNLPHAAICKNQNHLVFTEILQEAPSYYITYENVRQIAQCIERNEGMRKKGKPSACVWKCHDSYRWLQYKMESRQVNYLQIGYFVNCILKFRTQMPGGKFDWEPCPDEMNMIYTCFDENGEDLEDDSQDVQQCQPFSELQAIGLFHVPCSMSDDEEGDEEAKEEIVVE